MLALYALCVFPANIKHAVEGISVPGLPDTWWYHGPRLAAQPVLIWLALYAAQLIDWPFRARQSLCRGVSRPPGKRKIQRFEQDFTYSALVQPAFIRYWSRYASAIL
jgi:hypothetical protein